MQKKFIELYNDFDFLKNKNVNFKNSIKLIIDYSINEEKIVIFLEKIQKIMNEDDINEIYTNLLVKSGNSLNKKIKKFIVNFYSLEKEINIPIFLSIFKDCNDEIKGYFLDNLNNYYPSEKEEKDLLELQKNRKI